MASETAIARSTSPAGTSGGAPPARHPRSCRSSPPCAFPDRRSSTALARRQARARCTRARPPGRSRRWLLSRKSSRRESVDGRSRSWRRPCRSPASKPQERHDHVIIAEPRSRAARALPMAATSTTGSSRSHSKKIDEMDAAAVHHRIPVNLSAPAAHDLLKPAIKIIPLDAIDVPEEAAADQPFQLDEPGRLAKDQVRESVSRGCRARADLMSSSSR